MELNRAQLLVHDDEALARFRMDHNILDYILIERPSPNENANLVDGEGNRILVHTWLIHQAGIKLFLSLLLKEVMALCRLTFMHVSVNRKEDKGQKKLLGWLTWKKLQDLKLPVPYS